MRFTEEWMPTDYRKQPYWFETAPIPTRKAWRVGITWCKHEFGPADTDIGSRWSHDHVDGIYFRDAIDATVFKLRWC